jgi:hypothetical protein
MSRTDHDEDFRLVPLLVAAPETGKRIQVLALAASGRTLLFVQVRPGHVAYADKTPRIATHPGELDIRRSISWQTQRAIDEDRRRGLPVIVSPERRVDVAFLALDPAHAQSLLASRSVHVHWFSRGFKLQEGFLEPLALPSKLCLRPSGDAVGLGPWRGAPSEYTFKIELHDVLIDDRVPLHVDELSKLPVPSAVARTQTMLSFTDQVPTPSWSGLGVTNISFDIPEDDQLPLSPNVEMDDLYGLRERTLGVFILYAAAKAFYERPRAVPVENIDVINWLADPRRKDLEELFNRENARQACKFINPEHKKDGSGGNTWAERPFRSDVLTRASKKYQPHSHSSYISDYLAVIILASVEFPELARWRELAMDQKAKPAKRAKEMLDLIARFETLLVAWKFAGKTELSAVVDIVIWPERVVNLKKARRGRGSL